MLLRADAGEMIAIGQAAHAFLSGQLARRWGNRLTPVPEPFEEVCLAAAQHDIGMAEWDLAPSLNPRTGLPHAFYEMPLATHIGLWRAAPYKLLSQSRYAALLVSLHGSALYEHRDLAGMEAPERELVHGYLEDQRALQALLAERLGADRRRLAGNQRLLRAWDRLSLALCLGWRDPAPSGVPGSDGELELRLAMLAPARWTLDPWPFTGERVEVGCEGVRLRGRFAGQAELHRALERGPVVDLVFVLEPSSDARH